MAFFMSMSVITLPLIGKLQYTKFRNKEYKILTIRNAEFYPFRVIPGKDKINFVGNKSGNYKCIPNHTNDVPRNTPNDQRRVICLPNLQKLEKIYHYAIP